MFGVVAAHPVPPRTLKWVKGSESEGWIRKVPPAFVMAAMSTPICSTLALTVSKLSTVGFNRTSDRPRNRLYQLVCTEPALSRCRRERYRANPPPR
jgi:hypothetical protein